MIFKLREVSWESFLKPHWYTMRTGFLSFLTLRPIDTGYLFDWLAGMPSLYRNSDGKFAINDERIDAWSRLELNLIWSTANLRDHLQFFANRPFSVWAFAYNFPAPSYSLMKQRVRLSRDWFQIWIALLSFLIARTLDNPANTLPEWYSVIQKRGKVDEWFLQGISSSNLLNFSGAMPRVGTFLDLEQHHQGVEWFVGLNIPVWYHISSKIIDLAHKDPAHPMSNLIPPPGILNAILKPAPLRSLSISGASNNPSTATRSSPLVVQTPYVSWQEFFACREARNKEILAHEGPKERQVRLNREKQPPRRKTRVFEWSKGNDPEDDRLYRQLIPQKCHEDFFEMYSDAQSIYDAFHNEWDLCDESGPEDPDSDTEDGFDAFEDLGASAPTEHSVPSV